MERVDVSHVIDKEIETQKGKVTDQQTPKKKLMKSTWGRSHWGFEKDNLIIAIYTTQRQQSVYSYTAKVFA